MKFLSKKELTVVDGAGKCACCMIDKTILVITTIKEVSETTLPTGAHKTNFPKLFELNARLEAVDNCKKFCCNNKQIAFFIYANQRGNC